MARRMYDLDNGTENIKVKEIVANKITAVTSAITTEYDDLVVNGALTVKGGGSADNIIIGATGGGHPDYVKSNGGLSLMVGNNTKLSLATDDATFSVMVRFGSYTTAERPAAAGSNAGSVIYDTTLGKLILWNGTAWVNLDGSSLGE